MSVESTGTALTKKVLQPSEQQTLPADGDAVACKLG